MHIKVVQYSQNLSPYGLRDKIVVVIDLFRATSVIITALANDAKNIIVVDEVEEAILKFNKIGKSYCVLGGERELNKIEEFHYGNSPQSYVDKQIKDKIVILTTTNGTRAINFCTTAKEVYIGSMLNGSFLANVLSKKYNDIVLLCAGSNQEFSLEDAFCAGMLLFEMEKWCKFSTDDFGLTLKILYEENKERADAFLSTCKAYRMLKENGYEQDISFCLQKDIYTIAPRYINSEIIIQ